MTWFAFFSCFFAWFGIAPLMIIVREELDLTKSQVGWSIIASVAVTIFARFFIGYGYSPILNPRPVRRAVQTRVLEVTTPQDVSAKTIHLTIRPKRSRADWLHAQCVEMHRYIGGLDIARFHNLSVTHSILAARLDDGMCAILAQTGVVGT